MDSFEIDRFETSTRKRQKTSPEKKLTKNFVLHQKYSDKIRLKGNFRKIFFDFVFF